jgi:hypothetical protein
VLASALFVADACFAPPPDFSYDYQDLLFLPERP